MFTHRPVSVSLLAALLCGLYASAAPARPAVVTKPRAVSGPSAFAAGCGADIEQQGFGERVGETETEPSLAVDPRNPRQLVTAWMQDLYRGYVGGWSRDGGVTWSTSVVPGITLCSGGDFELAADPWLSTGPDGAVYLAGISLDVNDVPNAAGPPFLPFRSRLQVNVSRNGGRTWSAPAEVVGGEGRLHDKPALVADPRRRGYAYIVWTEFLTPLGPPAEGISFSRTTDGGRTWSAPLHLDFPVIAGSTPQGALPVVLPSGDLLALTTMRARNGTPDPHRILAMRSADRGRTWSAPTLVAEFPATDGRHSTPWSDPETGEAIDAPEWAISAAAAPSGTVYVTWRHAGAPGTADVRLAKSGNGGRTWSLPTTVASAGAQMFLPVVAVSGDGTVGVSYYDDRRDVLGDGLYRSDFRFAHSHDAGRTWNEARLAGFDMRSTLLRKIPVRGAFVGDYTGLVPLPRGFGSTFPLGRPQARTGGSDVFFSRIRTAPLRPAKARTRR